MSNKDPNSNKVISTVGNKSSDPTYFTYITDDHFFNNDGLKDRGAIKAGIEYKNPDRKINHPLELLEYPEYVTQYVKDGEWYVMDGEIASEIDVFRALSNMYPDLTRHYVLYKHVNAMGFKTDISGNITPLSIKFMKKEEVQDVDFIFIPADSDDEIGYYLDMIGDIDKNIPVYDRSKIVDGQFVNNEWGQAFVVAVMSEEGKVYPLRIQEVDLPERIQRGKRIEETVDLKKAIKDKKPKPRRHHTPIEFRGDRNE